MKKIHKFNDGVSNFLSKFFNKSNGKPWYKKLFASLMAIGIGVAVSMIFIAGTGVDPIQAFSSIFEGGIALKDQTWLYIGVFALVGMGIGFGFKSNVFNIGAPGQMMIAGAMSMMILLKYKNIGTGLLLLAMFVSMVSGFFSGAIAGVLKAVFGIHEVVSTIMLNWFFYYMTSFAFRKGSHFGLQAATEPTSQSLPTLHGMFAPDKIWILILLLVIIVAVLIWVLLKFTVFGFKVKATGKNADATQYGGSNPKVIAIISLGISGSLAGLSGFIYYVLKLSHFEVSALGPVSLGFDGIVVALLAFSNPFGSIFTATFYAFLNSGSTQLQFDTGMGAELQSILVGIIVYLASISIIFENFHIVQLIKRLYMFIVHKKYREAYKKHQEETKQLNAKYKKMMLEAKAEEKSNREQIQTNLKETKQNISKIKKQQTAKDIDKYLELEKQIKEIKYNNKMALQELAYKRDKSIKQELKAIKKTEKIAYKDSIAKMGVK